LAGVLHRWLGQNAWHDGLSLYSFSWLLGGHMEGTRLVFPQGATWLLSFYDRVQAERVVEGIFARPYVLAGMKVMQVEVVASPNWGERARLQVLTPVVVRRTRPDGGREYLIWDHPAADEALTRVFRRKLEAAGLGHLASSATMRFDRHYVRARTKLVCIKGIHHRGSLCPVIVEGPPEAVHFAWLVGAGELTGCGFGALGDIVSSKAKRAAGMGSPTRRAKSQT